MQVTFLQALQASQTKYLQGNENGAHDSGSATLQQGNLENPTVVPKAQHCMEAVRCAKSAGLKPSKWFLSRNESRKQFQVHFANAEGNKNLSIQFTILTSPASKGHSKALSLALALGSRIWYKSKHLWDSRNTPFRDCWSETHTALSLTDLFSWYIDTMVGLSGLEWIDHAWKVSTLHYTKKKIVINAYVYIYTYMYRQYTQNSYTIAIYHLHHL